MTKTDRILDLAPVELKSDQDDAIGRFSSAKEARSAVQEPRTLVEALSFLDNHIEPLRAIATIATGSATGHVLADDIVSGASLPRFDNSAMDGFAIREADVGPGGLTVLRLEETITAGSMPSRSLSPGSTARVMTGAPVPAGADRVVMQEHVTVSGSSVTLSVNAQAKSNIRLRGEDVARGSVMLKAGTRLSPGHQALLTAVGIPSVPVIVRPRVALLSTGDELIEVGQPLGEGQIYDTNRPMIRALLKDMGLDVTDYGIVDDDPNEIQAVLTAAAGAHDLVVTSGGASGGCADHLTEAVAKCGDMRFWKLNMRPGKPIGFGQIAGCPVLALPGNPVAAAAGFAIVGRHIINRMQGTPGRRGHLRLRFQGSYSKPQGRVQVLMARVIMGDDGLPVAVAALSSQSSASYSALSQADGFALLHADQTQVEDGDQVDVIPLWLPWA